MKPTYRNAVLAAGGVIAAAVAAGIIRSRLRRDATISQTVIVGLNRDEVSSILGDDHPIQAVVACELLVVQRDDASGAIEWMCESHPSEGAQLSLVDAPDAGSTELHLAMHADRREVKEIARRLKALLEERALQT
jgi:hypothetical protein